MKTKSELEEEAKDWPHTKKATMASDVLGFDCLTCNWFITRFYRGGTFGSKVMLGEAQRHRARHPGHRIQAQVVRIETLEEYEGDTGD